MKGFFQSKKKLLLLFDMQLKNHNLKKKECQIFSMQSDSTRRLSTLRGTLKSRNVYLKSVNGY